MILGAIYLLSGATGLVYEVLWAKYLALLFGSTALAHSIVLATFLGGLSLGSAWLGPWADRAPDPLRLYARLELALALAGLIPPLALPWAGSLYVSLLSAGAAPAAASLLRAALAASVLLVPTVLMGATLPALGRHLSRRGRSVGGAASWLYAVNSAGAVVGCLAAGYTMIPYFGLDFSTSLAAAGNLVCGLGALTLARRKSRPAAETAEPDGPPVAPALARRILWAAFAAGLVSLVYEIAWIRLLALVMGSSVYTFSAMLAAFIAGITLGAAAARLPAVRRLSPTLAFGLAELGAACAVVATVPLYDRLPYVFLILGGLFNRIPATFYLMEAGKFLVAFVLMLPPTVFIGMSLPLAAAAISRRARAGADLGRLWAFNTAGNVAGALLAGLWLLPLLGLHGLFAAGAAVNLAIGVLVVSTAEAPPRTKQAAVAAAAAIFAAAALFAPPWDKLMLTRGDFRMPLASHYPDFDRYREEVHRESLIFYDDDREATVSVERGRWGDLGLKVNGKVDASSGGDMGNQMLIAHIPLMMRPRSKDVLIVGMGSGVSAGSALAHDIDRLDVVEISPAVLQAARLFAPHNRNALDDPRLHVVVEDAKAYLKVSRRDYNLILSEPSNTWIAGVAGLYTQEFYEDAKSRLKPNGLFAQWFHLYEMNDATFALVLRTFASEFKHVTLWETTPGQDVLLVGEPGDAPVAAPSDLEHEFDRYEVRKDLARIGLWRLSTVLSLQAADDPVVRAAGGEGPVNEDRFPILEYEAPKAFWLQRVSKSLEEMDVRVDPAQRGRLLLADYLKSRGHKLTEPEFDDWRRYHDRNDPRISELARFWWARPYASKR